MTFAAFVLALVTLQRLVELRLAQRNTARLLVHGAREAAPEHYPFIVALHAAWLTGLWPLAYLQPPSPFWLGVYLILQALRVWVVTTLGPRWTTRIIVLPGAPLVQSGPYRYLSHPNYCVVAAEIMVLPMVFGLFWYGVVFSILNAILLAIRIRAENQALAA